MSIYNLVGIFIVVVVLAMLITPFNTVLTIIQNNVGDFEDTLVSFILPMIFLAIFVTIWETSKSKN